MLCAGNVFRCRSFLACLFDSREKTKHANLENQKLLKSDLGIRVLSNCLQHDFTETMYLLFGFSDRHIATLGINRQLKQLPPYTLNLVFHIRTPDDLQTSRLPCSLYTWFLLSFVLYRPKRISLVYSALSFRYIILRKTRSVGNTTVSTPCHLLSLKLCNNISSHTQNNPWDFYCSLTSFYLLYRSSSG